MLRASYLGRARQHDRHATPAFAELNDDDRPRTLRVRDLEHVLPGIELEFHPVHQCWHGATIERRSCQVGSRCITDPNRRNVLLQRAELSVGGGNGLLPRSRGVCSDALAHDRSEELARREQLSRISLAARHVKHEHRRMHDLFRGSKLVIRALPRARGIGSECCPTKLERLRSGIGSRIVEGRRERVATDRQQRRD